MANCVYQLVLSYGLSSNNLHHLGPAEEHIAFFRGKQEAEDACRMYASVRNPDDAYVVYRCEFGIDSVREAFFVTYGRNELARKKAAG